MGGEEIFEDPAGGRGRRERPRCPYQLLLRRVISEQVLSRQVDGSGWVGAWGRFDHEAGVAQAGAEGRAIAGIARQHAAQGRKHGSHLTAHFRRCRPRPALMPHFNPSLPPPPPLFFHRLALGRTADDIYQEQPSRGVRARQVEAV